MVKSRHLGWIAALGAAALLAVAGTSLAALLGPSPNVWIDAPLDGQVVARGEVAVIGHVTDPRGVTSVRLDVDGVEVGSGLVDDGPGALTTVTLSWTAETAGVHVLSLWALNSDGDDFGPALATVHVDGLPSTTATSTTTTATTTPPTTAPPTTAPPTTTAPPSTTTTIPATTTLPPCTVTAPTGLVPNGQQIGSSSTTLTWSYTGCPADEFEVVVLLEGETPIDSGLTPNMSWPVSGLSCGSSYTWSVRAFFFDDDPGPWASGSFTYQPLGGC